MVIVVIGTGYVCLVSGACLADLGHEVICVDNSTEKIKALVDGKMPIHEPGLAALVEKQAGKRLHFSCEAAAHMGRADIVMLAVGTPPSPDGQADLSFLFKAAEDIALHLRPQATIVVKSTVPVGTARRLRQRISVLRPIAKGALISNPEFLREGCAIKDFMEPDRIVIGHGRGETATAMSELYAPLLAKGVPLVAMSNEAAELCKYAANTYLAMRVAYVNELADLCEAVGADIESVTLGMGLDRRIGQHYLHPGPGFGGSCFPKDTSALLASAEAAGVDFRLGKTIVESNERRKHSLVSRVARAVGGVLTGKTIAVLGLAFKANTDDTRDSAALRLVADLQARGAKVRAYDPVANKAERSDSLSPCTSAQDAVRGADAAVIMTEWQEFRALDLHMLARLLRQPVLVDFRNLFGLAKARAAGLSYHSLGRATVRKRAPRQRGLRPSRSRLSVTA